MRYTTSVYFFNEKQELIRRVTERYLVQVTQEKEITADKTELLMDMLTVSTVYDLRIASAAYMAVKESDKSFSLYSITDIQDPDNRLIFTGLNFALKELEGFVVKDIRPQKRPIAYVANQIIEFTNGEWRLGYTKPDLPVITDTFYYLSVKDSLKQLQSHGCEVLFKCKIENRRITDKWIEVYDQIGTASNKRFTYGTSALSIVKQQDRSQIYTSLIGRGKGEEVGDGYGRRLEFTDLVWSTSSGKPANKPAGQNWIELPDMTAQYGIPTKAGTMRKREGVIVFEDIEDTEELLLNTYNALQEMCRPLIQYKTAVLNGDAIGNTVQVHYYERGYHYRARIFKVVIDRLTGKVDSAIGDNLTGKNSMKVSSDLKLDLERVQVEKPSFYTAEQIAQWQTDIIRGLKGGSYILLTEADLGISERRVPYCSVWMNGQSLETSDHFLVANSEGIGFINGDFNLDNFHTAWTIDGVFNARYIQVGRLGGEQLFLDLDTGEVFFGKGFIRSTDGTMEINITEGIITGPIIRSYRNRGITAGIEIQAGDIRIVDSNNNVMAMLGTLGLTGGGTRLSTQQGNMFVIGTENGGTVGSSISIPTNSTAARPIINYNGEHNFQNANPLKMNASSIDMGLGRIILPSAIRGDGTIETYWTMQW